MSFLSRINKSNYCEITQFYSNNHKAIDIVGKNYTVDDIICHSDGVVEKVIKNINYNSYGTDNKSYGNYIIIKHNNFLTLYSHIKYNTIKLNVGDKVKKGDYLGRMGNTGYSNGVHLHFEVRDNFNNKIDPLFYLNNDFDSDINDKEYYIIKKGDTLTSIAKKFNTNVDILIKNNNIKNKDLIFTGDRLLIKNVKYLKNDNNNVSLVDALKEINVDSSFANRKKIAELNKIFDYKGTSEQNIKLLNLLKKGLLIVGVNG